MTLSRTIIIIYFMNTRKNYTSQIVAIAFVMILALAYFVYYRQQMNDAFRIKRPLPLSRVEYEDSELARINMDALPSNIIFDQSLMLVNRDHIPGEDFNADVIYYHDTDVLMNRAIIDSYASLSAAVSEKFDEKLYVESSYRSREHQQEIYEESGPEIAAVPGTSEHETGLALDVYVMYYGGAGFINSRPGKFVNDHCEDYGFIIRYPRGEEEITGFEYEPWHIRYVGQPHACLIASCNLTLEDYIDRLTPGRYYRLYVDDVSDAASEGTAATDGWLIARLPEDDIRIPSEYLGRPIRISPDNTGCVIVTIEIS